VLFCLLWLFVFVVLCGWCFVWCVFGFSCFCCVLVGLFFGWVCVVCCCVLLWLCCVGFVVGFCGLCCWGCVVLLWWFVVVGVCMFLWCCVKLVCVVVISNGIWLGLVVCCCFCGCVGVVLVFYGWSCSMGCVCFDGDECSFVVGLFCGVCM
jgi:hypothetical protein